MVPSWVPGVSSGIGMGILVFVGGTLITLYLRYRSRRERTIGQLHNDLTILEPRVSDAIKDFKQKYPGTHWVNLLETNKKSADNEFLNRQAQRTHSEAARRIHYEEYIDKLTGIRRTLNVAEATLEVMAEGEAARTGTPAPGRAGNPATARQAANPAPAGGPSRPARHARQTAAEQVIGDSFELESIDSD